MPHLVLIDGYGFVFRAYHSLPPLTDPHGTPVGAVYGFANMLFKLQLDGLHADHIAVILDAGEKNIRHEIYDKYKANRPPAPEDLIPQFPLIPKVAEAMNIACVSQKGYEADDLIATYTKQAKHAGFEVTIVSSDKDLMQLVDDQAHVTMYDGMKAKKVMEKEVIEKFGVTPDKVLDVLAMMGDSSDNVPGIPGIGPKTAAELIQQYGSLDEVLSHAHEIKQPKRRETIIQNQDMARLSRQLVSLYEDVTDLPALEQLQAQAFSPDKLSRFLSEKGFKSLLPRIDALSKARSTEATEVTEVTDHTPSTGKEVNTAPPATTTAATATATATATTTSAISISLPEQFPYQIISNEKELATWVEAKRFCFQLTVFPLFDEQAELFALALASDANGTTIIPIRKETAAGEALDLFGTAVDNSADHNAGLSLAACLLQLKPLLSPTHLWISHHIKPLLKHGGVAAYDDLMLMSYALDAGLHDHALNTLSYRHLGVALPSFEELCGSGKQKQNIVALEKDTLYSWLAQCCQHMLVLYPILRQALFEQHLLSIYYDIERPLLPVIATMEQHGITVDPATLRSLSQQFHQRKNECEQTIIQLAGTDFNIGSPKQLGEILFDQLGLTIDGKAPKRTKTGAYVTNAETLEHLQLQHPIIEPILEWRKLSKLISTYTDTLVEMINPATKRVHTHYAMTVTTTGRLSSHDPNLQNIPIRDKEGQKIREAFVAPPGSLLISADYSQIELRLLAEMADITSLKEAFRQGVDIHALTASEIFHVPLEQMDAMTRRKAKAINFGIIYGISPFGLAKQLDIPQGEAKRIIERYFERFPGILRFMDECKQHAYQHGFVTTLFGRKCHIEGIHHKRTQAFAERAAINAPLQGTAADIIKRAMIQIQHEIQARSLPLKMLLQVHDELIFEAPESEVARLMPWIKRIMEHAAIDHFPLIVDIDARPSWGK